MCLVGTYQHSTDSPLLRQDLSEYSTQCLMNQAVLQSAWWAQALFPTLCELWALYPPNPFGWFFLWSQVVSTHAWANQCTAQDSRGPSAYLWGSFSLQPSSLWHFVA